MIKKEGKITVSCFFPFLNDWATIGGLVARADNLLSKKTSNYEIIIVDDGSSKKSKGVIKAIKHYFPKVRIITHQKNLGYGAAIKSGIKASRFDWIFYTDGDAQYDPDDLALLLKAVNSKVDIINGYKIKRADPLHRIIAGKIYHHFVRFLFNTPIRDTDCDFRLMRRIIFSAVVLESNSGLICAEMIKKIADFGFRFKEVPIPHYWRTSGKSQFFNFQRVFQVVCGLLKLWHQLVIKKTHLRNSRAHH